MKLKAKLIVVALLSSVLPGLIATAPAQAMTSTSPCHGYVYNMWKSNGYVHSTYWIYCTQHVDKIQLKTFLRGDDRWVHGDYKTCYNTYICTQTLQLKDLAGSQFYSSRAEESDGFGPTYVQLGSHVWDCNDTMFGTTNYYYMRCGGKGMNF